MPCTPQPPPDPEHERDATIIAHLVALVHARSKRDYLTAADAHRELDRLGVSVRFRRTPKSAGVTEEADR